jgi:hypothetical protein
MQIARQYTVAVNPINPIAPVAPPELARPKGMTVIEVFLREL